MIQDPMKNTHRARGRSITRSEKHPWSSCISTAHRHLCGITSTTNPMHALATLPSRKLCTRFVDKTIRGLPDVTTLTQAKSLAHWNNIILSQRPFARTDNRSKNQITAITYLSRLPKRPNDQPSATIHAQQMRQSFRPAHERDWQETNKPETYH